MAYAHVLASGRYHKYGFAIAGNPYKGDTVKLSFPVEFLSGFTERARGLLFKKPDEVTRVFISCKDVHTFGMRHPLDIAFLNKDGTVIKVCRKVFPYRRVRVPEASCVAERFTADTPWLELGHTLIPCANKPVDENILKTVSRRKTTKEG